MFHVEQFPPEKRMVSPEKATSDCRSGHNSYSGIVAAAWRLKLIFIGFLQCFTWNSARGKDILVGKNRPVVGCVCPAARTLPPGSSLFTHRSSVSTSELFHVEHLTPIRARSGGGRKLVFCAQSAYLSSLSIVPRGTMQVGNFAFCQQERTG